MIGRIALVAGGALAAGGAALLATRAATDRPAPEDDRWLTVTVFAGPEEVAPNGAPPAPLAELGDAVEIRLKPAPGERGTELAARPRSGPAADALRTGGGAVNARERVRIALRASKQLVEAGEVLLIDPRPAGSRPRTPAGAVIDAIITRSRGEGVL